MFIILGSDGVEYGPADAAMVRSWMAEGRAVLQSKARRADSAEWRTLGEFPEFAPAATPPPLSVEEPREPVRIDAKAYAADLIARAKPLDITGCITRGWAFYTSDFWAILGVTLATMFLAGAVPVIGVSFGMAGLYYYYLGRMRGRQRQLSDVFVGFHRMTMPLVMSGLVMTGIILAAMLPMYAAFFAGMLMGAPVVGIICAALCYLAVMYVSTVLTFTFPLIIDKGLDWKDAITVSRKVVGSQFWRFLGMTLLSGLIACLGMVVFIVGIYLLIPLCVAASAQAYEDLCNPPPRP